MAAEQEGLGDQLFNVLRDIDASGFANNLVVSICADPLVRTSISQADQVPGRLGMQYVSC